MRQTVKVRAVPGALVTDMRGLDVSVRRFIGRVQVPAKSQNGDLEDSWLIIDSGVDVELDSYIKKCLRNGSLVSVNEEKPKKGIK